MPAEEDDRFQGPDFWRDEEAGDWREMVRHAVKWAAVFFVLIGFMTFALWWAGAALHFGASRANQTTAATYSVFGKVINSSTGEPVPFARLADDPAGHPPLFEATANMYGAFTLMTLAEPHTVNVAALGFKRAQFRIGKAWYRWFPYGSQTVTVKVEPE